jgi:alkylation response protein AidB-like acyl-CoA dehydrogenase
MPEYQAPLKDMLFVLREVAGMDQVTALPGCGEATPEVVEAILEEAARFAGDVLSPLNAVGDREGVRWENGEVFSATGFADAYRQFTANGWSAIGGNPAHGGQGLPSIVSAAVDEMWNSANLSFSLCPLLTQGAIEALERYATPEQRALYLPRLVSGQWSGTMNLTEPQAGSDLAAVRTRAVPQPDGSYRVTGQKIFITWGEHDMTENIVHLVLARTPDAPPGVKGLSLFVVPKFLPDAAGNPGVRNDLRCLSTEHKLGIHASPTCVMAYGDQGGATGFLVGKENEGLRYMFVMMNAARFGVGVEGLGISERAYQHALAYARERIQCAAIEGSTGSVPIIRHPDVRRMLLQMKSRIEAMRALAYSVAAWLDIAARDPDPEQRKRQQARVELLIPVVKGWLTESAITITSLGVQIHGGTGFIEQTGAAQHLRDARITAIYEGTTGIQANDLIGRKLARDGGATLTELLVEMRQTQSALQAQGGESLAELARSLGEGIDAVAGASRFIVSSFGGDPRAAAAGRAALRHHPVDVLGRVLDVAGLAVHAVLRVDLQARLALFLATIS